MPEQITDKVHNHRHQAGGISCRAHDLIQKLGGEILGADVGHGAVQHRAQDLQVRLLHGNGELDELVEHLIAVQHHHQDEAAPACQDQIVPANGCALSSGGGGDGGKIGGLGYQLCHLFHHFIHTLHFFLDGAVDGFGFVHTQAVIHHQLIHIQPVAGSRGDPARAGVGLLQITHGSQVCHFVSDGCGGIVHVRQLRDGLGAHRLGGTDIQVYHAAQDLLFSVGQLHADSSFPSLALTIPEC